MSNGSAAPPQIASVQLSENANADVENGRPSRSRGQDRPFASTPLRTRRGAGARVNTGGTPQRPAGNWVGCGWVSRGSPLLNQGQCVFFPGGPDPFSPKKGGV